MTETSVREGEEIQFGDLITLLVQDGDGNDGFLSAEGMLDEDCKIARGNFDTPPTDLHSCVFRVLPMYQYYAQTEYRDHIEKFSSIDPGIQESTDASVNPDNAAERNRTENEIRRTAQILAEALDKEIQLNAQTAERRFGKPLCYGQTAMLLHYKSQKILTMFPQQVATHETSCLKVQLNATGGLASALVLTPRYRIHANGDKIESMHQMLIQFPKQDGQMLHANMKYEEVSASTVASTWKICRYSPFNRNEAEYVNISQMIRLYQPNSESYVASNGEKVYLEKKMGTNAYGYKSLSSVSPHLPACSNVNLTCYRPLMNYIFFA